MRALLLNSNFNMRKIKHFLHFETFTLSFRFVYIKRTENMNLELEETEVGFWLLFYFLISLIAQNEIGN